MPQIDLPGTKFRKAKAARVGVVAALARAVEAYRAAHEAGGRPPASMLSYYMKARATDGDPLDSAELTDMVLGLLLAGHDTSHAGHVVLLASVPRMPPRVRAALAAEQAAVVAKHGDALSFAALADMPYAEAVSKECLRMLGPADGLFRQAAADFELHGVRVPAGSVLYLSNLYAKAVDPRLVGGGGLPADAPLPPSHMDINRLDASFRPERWLGGEPEPTSVATFGMGPHFCLGMPLYMLEAKALLARLVREYDVTMVGEPNVWAPSWAAQIARNKDIYLRFVRKPEAAAISAATVGRAGVQAGTGSVAAGTAEPVASA